MPLRPPLAQTILVGAVIGIGIFALTDPSSSGYRDYTAASAATVERADTALRPAATPEAARAPAPAEESRRVVRVRKGDTLMDIMVRSGVPRPDSHAAITTLKKVFDPRKLKAGQDIAFLFGARETADLQVASGPEVGGPKIGGPKIGGPAARAARVAKPTPPVSRLLSLTLAPTFDHEVGVEREADGGFAPVDIQKEFTRETVRAGGVIKTSLFETAETAGIPAKVMIKMVRAFSYDVDFQRDIQAGDSFEIAFERLTDDAGQQVQTGEILYAALKLSGTHFTIYGFTPKNGKPDFFNEKGESVRKALLRTPVDGARLSSRYGKRKHPILGYTRMHRGIDFAAPKGSPIVAAGNGVIDRAGRNGNYGNYIRIRHNSEYATAYAHLSRFAKGVRRGKRVKQGQVIGYVGATGLATGPHLHFEVMRNGKKLNPLTVKLPSGRKLKGAEFERFQTARADIDRLVVGLPLETKIASNQ